MAPVRKLARASSSRVQLANAGRHAGDALRGLAERDRNVALIWESQSADTFAMLRWCRVSLTQQRPGLAQTPAGPFSILAAEWVNV